MSNKQQQWLARFARYERSPQTVADFCAAEGVSPANFYLWKRRLANTTPAATPVTPTLVPIQITPTREVASSDHLELVLPSGAVLRFPATSSPALIVAVLQAWEMRSC